MDTDVVIVKAFTPLMCHDFTMGMEDVTRLNNGILISKPHAPFISHWWNVYKSQFNSLGWGEASIIGSSDVARQHPELIHVEETSMNRPSYFETDLIYKGKFNWSEKYSVHLWYRYHHKEYNHVSIRRLKNSLGEIFRYIWYNSSKK